MSAQVMSAIDDRLLAFEQAARSGTSVPEVDPFLPPSGDPDRPEAVRELVRVALELRWSRGDRPNLADYLERHPELAEPEAIAAVAYEDYRQRVLAGEQPSRDNYHAQFGIDVSDWPCPDAATSRRAATLIDPPLSRTPARDASEVVTVRVFPAGRDIQPSGLQPGGGTRTANAPKSMKTK